MCKNSSFSWGSAPSARGYTRPGGVIRIQCGSSLFIMNQSHSYIFPSNRFGHLAISFKISDVRDGNEMIEIWDDRTQKINVHSKTVHPKGTCWTEHHKMHCKQPGLQSAPLWSRQNVTNLDEYYGHAKCFQKTGRGYRYMSLLVVSTHLKIGSFPQLGWKWRTFETTT